MSTCFSLILPAKATISLLKVIMKLRSDPPGISLSRHAKQRKSDIIIVAIERESSPSIPPMGQKTLVLF